MLHTPASLRFCKAAAVRSAFGVSFIACTQTETRTKQRRGDSYAPIPHVNNVFAFRAFQNADEVRIWLSQGIQECSCTHIVLLPGSDG